MRAGPMWTRDLGFLRRHGWKILAAFTAYALGMSVVERSTLPIEFWFGFLGAIGAMALLWLAAAGLVFVGTPLRDGPYRRSRPSA
jgi:hypothetical protein